MGFNSAFKGLKKERRYQLMYTTVMQMTSINSTNWITSVRTCPPVWNIQNIYNMRFVLWSAVTFRHYIASGSPFRYWLHFWRCYCWNASANLQDEHCCKDLRTKPTQKAMLTSKGKNKTATTVEDRLFSQVNANHCLDDNMKNISRKLYLTHWGREGSFKLFKRPLPGVFTILTL